MGYRINLFAIVSFLILIALFFSSALPLAVRADANIVRVPNDFSTIQAAIDAVPQGTTILVNDGIYLENLHINKTINLLGADREDTTIDGFLNGTVIVVGANNVQISGFTVMNSSNNGGGIVIDHSDDCLINDNIITLNALWGIALNHSNNDSISENIISRNGQPIYYGEGIGLFESFNNTIKDNIVTNSTAYGFLLVDSGNNTIFGNAIDEKNTAFDINNCTGNVLFRNNILEFGTFLSGDYYAYNEWSYAGQGNYWKDYTGLDDGSGGRTAGDSIGDTDLPWHGLDNYPFTIPITPIQIFWNNEAFPTSLASNSTVSAFTFDQPNKEIFFVATGPANTTGYFNVSIPKTLLSGSWRIMLNQTDATSKSVIVENQTYTMIFLNYNHSFQNIGLMGTQVIPEYPGASIFLLAMLLTLASEMSILKRRHRCISK